MGIRVLLKMFQHDTLPISHHVEPSYVPLRICLGMPAWLQLEMIPLMVKSVCAYVCNRAFRGGLLVAIGDDSTDGEISLCICMQPCLSWRTLGYPAWKRTSEGARLDGLRCSDPTVCVMCMSRICHMYVC